MISRFSASFDRRLLLLVVLSLSAMTARGALAQASPAAGGGSRAALHPGDKVRLKIYREPDLSGEFVVAEDGIVVFPKVGRINVEPLSTDSLTALLVSQYSLSLRQPAIEVTVLRRVNVIGAVRNPGFYYADPTVTVRGALALAGGVTPEGNKNRVELVRGTKRSSISLSDPSSLADSPVESGDEVSAPERSWFARNTGLVISGVTGLAVVIVTLVRR
jgi:protein involved in polysaccharide export with SLBB domain